MSELQRKPPLLLDGAAGTEFMKLGLPAGVCVEQWLCEHPEAIHQVLSSHTLDFLTHAFHSVLLT